MRSSLASVLLGLSFVAACSVGDSGTTPPGGGDDVQPQPDANNQQNPTPKLTVTLDKPTISTELLSTNMITVTLTGSDGFSGDVTLAASALDAASAPLPGWTATLSVPSVTVPLNGTATAVVTLSVPSENKGLAGEVDVVATSTLGAQTVKSTVSVANQITRSLTLNGANCVYPTVKTFSVSVGTKVRFQNDSNENIIIHMDNNDTSGLTHESNTGTNPGSAYEKVVASVGNGNTVNWYCHNRNDPQNLKITPVAAQ